ncbi:histidine kinase [Lewinella sp. W8]|uniref:histidine kinase n=1 Tax=Lewinella sp. W8 TaxID=2528208 RepID=UPI001565F389|nr:histidine kinase [Lewinella sp. W8]
MIFASNIQLLCQANGEAVYTFHHLTARDGLTSSQYNHHIFRDSIGYVWISSIVGLNRFDGHRVKQYHPGDNGQYGLLNEQASQSAFGQIPGKGMWFTNDVSLTKYDVLRDRFHHYRGQMPNGIRANDTYWWNYVDSTKGVIFVSGGRHLFSFRPGVDSSLVHVDDIHVGVRDVMDPKEDGGYVLMRNFFGESYFDVSVYSIYRRESAVKRYFSPDSSSVRTTAYLNGGKVLVGTKTGLFILTLDTGYWEAIWKGKSGKGVYVEALVKRAEGEYVIGTATEGIYFFDLDDRIIRGPMLTNVAGEIKPFITNLVKLYLGQDNVLWVSAKNDGVYFVGLDAPKFSTISPIIGKERDVVRISSDEENGVLWIAGLNSVLMCSPKDTISYEINISGQELEQIKSLHIDNEGTVWVGTLKYLFKKSKGDSAFREFVLPYDGMQYPGYNDLVSLPSGEILAATNRKGILRISKDRTSCFWDSTSLVRPRIMKMKGDVLLVTTLKDSFHIIRVEASNNQLFVDTTLLGIPYLTGIFPQDDSTFWLGSHGGLFKLDVDFKRGHKLFNIPLAEASVVIHGIAAVGEELIMSTASGVLTYNINNGSSQVYSLSDGLLGGEYIFRSAHHIPDRSKAFFGGTDGITVISPEFVNNGIAKASPVITGIEINNGEFDARNYCVDTTLNVSFIRQLKVPYTHNTIEIQTSPLEYSDPKSCLFRYRISGPDRVEFLPPSTNSTLSLTALREGGYDISIWATNSDYAWAGPRELRIEVLPPWYRTWWAYVLYAITILGTIGGVLRYRYLKLREVELAELDKAKAEAHAAETETSILRLQMNPHFIFNSLNSIDDYIIGEEPLRAHDYLVMFAELIRDILHRSTQPLTRLDREVDMLEKYIEAERMRVGEQLKYHIAIDDEVDTISTWIPTMILQPFVENAIWHGIGHREEGGTIVLSFRIDEDREEIVATVEDDGVGRTNARGGDRKHKSMAMDITRQRLALLNERIRALPERTPGDARYEIIDLKDQDGRSSGTRIVLYLPLIYPEDYESSSD